MNLKVKLDEGARVSKAYNTDAGIDLHSREEKIVPARGSAVFDTGVHIELPKVNISGSFGLPYEFYTAGILKSKSGLNVNHDIISTGTIDYSYRGSIKVKLINNGDSDYLVKVGDKISQLVIVPIITPTAIKIVDELSEGERGDNGFGSSGR
jgi:dUTP pyrophosphatase